MNTLINFDFQMPVHIHQRSHARLNRKNSEKRKQTVCVNSQNFQKCELKIDLLTEVLYELVKMFFARIQLTGGTDKHSMSQSERIYRFDSRPHRKPVFSLFLIRYLVSLHDLLRSNMNGSRQKIAQIQFAFTNRKC